MTVCIIVVLVAMVLTAWVTVGVSAREVRRERPSISVEQPRAGLTFDIVTWEGKPEPHPRPEPGGHRPLAKPPTPTDGMAILGRSVNLNARCRLTGDPISACTCPKHRGM